MFAIAFDLDTKAARRAIQASPGKAYSEIQTCLAQYDFAREQGSVYVTDKDDLANLFSAINALKALPWFPASVRHVRAFRVENGSDFTDIIKGS